MAELLRRNRQALRLHLRRDETRTCRTLRRGAKLRPRRAHGYAGPPRPPNQAAPRNGEGRQVRPLCRSGTLHPVFEDAMGAPPRRAGGGNGGTIPGRLRPGSQRRGPESGRRCSQEGRDVGRHHVTPCGAPTAPDRRASVAGGGHAREKRPRLEKLCK